MHQNERERQRHRSHYRSGLQPSPLIRNTSWGFAPCWDRAAPSALSTRSHLSGWSNVLCFYKCIPEKSGACQAITFDYIATPAPTARLIPAWGETPCTAAPNSRGLKARPIPASGGSELL
jgi:hypothetical protein